MCGKGPKKEEVSFHLIQQGEMFDIHVPGAFCQLLRIGHHQCTSVVYRMVVASCGGLLGWSERKDDFGHITGCHKLGLGGGQCNDLLEFGLVCYNPACEHHNDPAEGLPLGSCILGPIRINEVFQLTAITSKCAQGVIV